MANGEGNAVLTVVVAGVLAAAALLGVRAAYDFSHERIAANQRARLVQRLNSVLDPALRGRDLNMTRLRFADPELLGSPAPVDVFVVSDRGQPVATVISSVAPHGYNAPIDLVIGVGADSSVTGVRAVSYRETPGLGDMIDRGKSSWIEQFRGKSLQAPARELWLVKQDKGEFDSVSGATVTSRAVVMAVKNALLYFEQHRDEIYRAAQEPTATGP